MLDKKQLMVLKVLNKLAMSGSFKVVTVDDISSLLSQKISVNNEEIKIIIEFLDKEGYINLKFAEDNTYCYSINAKTTLYLSQTTSPTKQKKSKPPILHFVLTLLSSFIGTMLALVIFFYLAI